MPPFFKLTLVVLCAYILWTFNHPDPNEPFRGYEGRPGFLNRPPRNYPGAYPQGNFQFQAPQAQAQRVAQAPKLNPVSTAKFCFNQPRDCNLDSLACKTLFFKVYERLKILDLTTIAVG